MSRSIYALLLLTAALCGTAPPQPPPEKFANQIKAYTDAASVEKDILAQMLAVAQDMSEFAKEDIKLITAYLEEAATTLSSGLFLFQSLASFSHVCWRELFTAVLANVIAALLSHYRFRVEVRMKT